MQKVFDNQYNVEHINLDSNNVTATFVSKNNIIRKDAANLIKDIQADVLTKLGNQTLTYTVTNSDGNTTTSNLDLEITK